MQYGNVNNYFFAFSFGKIWKFRVLLLSLQLIWNQEQGAKNKDLIALAMIIHKGIIYKLTLILL